MRLCQFFQVDGRSLGQIWLPTPTPPSPLSRKACLILQGLRTDFCCSVLRPPWLLGQWSCPFTPWQLCRPGSSIYSPCLGAFLPPISLPFSIRARSILLELGILVSLWNPSRHSLPHCFPERQHFSAGFGCKGWLELSHTLIFSANSFLTTQLSALPTGYLDSLKISQNFKCVIPFSLTAHSLTCHFCPRISYKGQRKPRGTFLSLLLFPLTQCAFHPVQENFTAFCHFVRRIDFPRHVRHFLLRLLQELSKLIFLPTISPRESRLFLSQTSTFSVCILFV